ncbi:MAG: hypothetical protein AAGE03_12950 [Pseudomonadota bacterium]
MELVVGIAMEAFDSCLFDCQLHSPDLTIGPRALHLGQAMFDLMVSAGPVKGVLKS